MNTEEALDFLREYQPLPDDKELSRDIIRRYNEVRRYFEIYPDERCIPLFLNSFGNGDGFGVYQLVEDVLATYSSSVLEPHLTAALSSPRRSVRYWAAEISARYPMLGLIEPLSRLLKENDEDMAVAAAIAIGQISSSLAQERLQEALQATTSAHLIAVIREQINDNRATMS